MKATLNPTQRYRQDLDQGRVVADAAQEQAIGELQALFEKLQHNWRRGGRGSLLDTLLGRKPAKIRGLYLWGGVGRGKTYLMDLFYQCLPSTRKQRIHFHRFMQMVHRRLQELAGEKNPLQQAARGIARDCDVICFDEFFVTDIGDAMLLANLLETLFEEGVVLVATSNVPPHKLYENGLQRDNFLPAIALLEKHTRVVNVDGGVDYRLRSLENAEIYHSPLDAAAEDSLMASFRDLSAGLDVEPNHVLNILGRTIRTRYWTEDLVWFEFEEICGGPRGPADYIEIARLFHTVIISGIPVLDEYRNDMAKRFVNLVDEFYDHKVKLIVSAAAPLAELYRGYDLKFVFERTRSRLLEMQSRHYLALEHAP